MLILILIDVHHSQKAVFSFEKGSNHQYDSSSGSCDPVKFLICPTHYCYLKNSPPPPKKKSKSVRLPPFMTKILENLTPLLKSTIIQKSKDSVFKETQNFISNNEITTQLNVEI